MNRQSLQQGCVSIKPRAAGADAWVYRFRDGNKHRSVVLGRADQMNEAGAWRKARTLRSRNFEASETMAALLDLYEKEGMPARHSTSVSYKASLKRIREEFGDKPIDDTMTNIMAVERWLKDLRTVPTKNHPARPLAGRSKGHIKAIMHRLAEFAMKMNLIDIQRNPMALVELRGSTRKVRNIPVLEPAQYQALLQDKALPEHVRVMVQVAMLLGLRASEMLGLRWEDVDLLGQTIHIRRSIVGAYQDETKTEASEQKLPLHPHLAGILMRWRQHSPVIEGWVFGSPLTDRPYHRDSLQQKHLAPAGLRIGIPNLGWHAFRHTYRAQLRRLGLPLEVQQKLMRHADLATTTRYGQSGSMLDEMRPANALLAEQLHSNENSPRLPPEAVENVN